MKTEKPKIFKNIIICLIIISTKKIGNFKCGADKIKINPGILNTIEEKNKRRLDIEYKPLKIKVDFSSFIKNDLISESNFNALKILIDETALEFQKFVKIKHSPYDLNGLEEEIKNRCNINAIDKDYENFLFENDLLIFPIFSLMKETSMAAAKYCFLTSEFRPIIGVLYINPNLLFNKKNNNLFIKNLLFHEITHILIFDSDLLIKLDMTKTLIKDGTIKTYVKSKKVLHKVRQHFNCGSLLGIALENQDETDYAGSHWDARYMLGDYMTSLDYIDNILSDITLALFEDSGFYKVEYFSGGLFKFGKNKGCEFINRKCLVNEKILFKDEFCNILNQPICSSSKISKGLCLINNYENEIIPIDYQYFSDPTKGGFKETDYCPIGNINSSNYKDSYYPTNCKSGSEKLDQIYGEDISENSFCFISSLLPASSNMEENSQAICYRIECNNNKKEIIIHIGSSIINCPTNGGNISNPSGFKGEIICPKYYDICTFDNNNICNDLFDCLNKKVKTDINTYIYEGDNIFVNYKEIKSSARNYKYNFYIIFIIFLLMIFF